MKQVRIGLAALATTGLLAACGGGGSGAVDDPQAANEVPAAAVSSTKAYVEFASALAQSDTAEPLVMSKLAAPPTSETEAPLDV